MNEETLDDRGTTQEQAHTILNDLCEDGFDGDPENSRSRSAEMSKK